MAIERNELEAARHDLAAAMQWAVRARERMHKPGDGIHEANMLMVECLLHKAEHDHNGVTTAVMRALSISRSLHSPRLESNCLAMLADIALARVDFAEAAVQIDARARLAAEFALPLYAALAQAQRAELDLQAGQWDAAVHQAAAAAAGFLATGDVISELCIRNHMAEALWRGGRVDKAVAIWEQTALAWKEMGNEASARAVRLRLADSLAGSGQADDIDAARQAVLAELPALLAARLAGWRVLHRAGDLAAAVQLALAAAELEHHLNGFSDPEVRERVRHTVPWHRDVVEALAQSNAAA
jgi:hypothetical protein